MYNLYSFKNFGIILGIVWWQLEYSIQFHPTARWSSLQDGHGDIQRRWQLWHRAEPQDHHHQHAWPGDCEDSGWSGEEARGESSSRDYSHSGERSGVKVRLSDWFDWSCSYFIFWRRVRWSVYLRWLPRPDCPESSVRQKHGGASSSS